eukprot:3321238-Pleurochrysis_carterae.AAC.2
MSRANHQQHNQSQQADPLEQFWAAEAAETATNEVIEDLLHRTYAQLHAKCVCKRILPIAVSSAATDMMSIVRAFYIECDPGEVRSSHVDSSKVQ